MEQVVATNAVPGIYTVVVSHKGTLKNQFGDPSGQSFSLILNDKMPPYEIDSTLHLSRSTNGLPRLEWEALPGSVQAVMASDNLIIPARWAALPGSTQAVICIENDWVDPSGFSDDVKFYKIQELE